MWEDFSIEGGQSVGGFCVLLGIGFMIVGYSFWTGKGPDHIKAWQETTEEEKKQVNIEQLSKNIACIFGLASIIFILAGIVPTFKEKGFIWCMFGWFLVTGADVYYISKSNESI